MTHVHGVVVVVVVVGCCHHQPVMVTMDDRQHRVE